MKSALVYVCQDQGRAPEWVRLLPLGRVELRDGREWFEVGPADLERLIAKFRDEGVDLVVDYEHQTLRGGKAPAAGWIKDLEARDDGLWARVEWTEEARRHIEAGEYRYYSPVVRLAADTRRPLALLHVGLVNDPAIKDLTPLLAAKYGEAAAEVLVLASATAAHEAQAARSRKYRIGIKAGGHLTKPGEWAEVPDDEWGDPVNYRYPMPDAKQARAAWSYWNQEKNQQQYSPEERRIITRRISKRAQALGLRLQEEGETDMKEALQRMLGIGGERSDAEILALADNRLRAAALPEIAQVAGLGAEATVAEIKGAVLALKQGQEQLAALQREVAALQAERAQALAAQAVDEALAARKITPAQRDWALKYAQEDPAGFRTFTDLAPEVIPAGVALQPPKETGGGDLDADDLEFCKQLGLSAEAYKAARQRQA